jgi:hypothetical protein
VRGRETRAQQAIRNLRRVAGWLSAFIWFHPHFCLF